jgi:hypothetical protein
VKSFLKLVCEEEMGIRLYRQGTLIDEIEPDEFFCYWKITDTDDYANNVPLLFKDSYQVYFYCKETCVLEDDDYLENKMKDFESRCRKYGLAVSDDQDINSGLDSYIAKMCRVRFAQHE